MSGYPSKAEARETVRRTLDMPRNTTRPDHLPVGAANYYLSRVCDAVIYDRGTGYGWGIESDSDKFWAVAEAAQRGSYAIPAAREPQTPEEIAERVMNRWRCEVAPGWGAGTYQPNDDQVAEMITEAVKEARA